MTVSFQDAAKVLGVSERFLLNLVQAGELQAIFSDGHYHFEPLEVRKWAEQNCRPIANELINCND